MSTPSETTLLGESRIVCKILDYLEAHPDAKDSAEGIAQWWVEEDALEVRCVLEQLVALGKLDRSSASTAFYVRAGRDRVHTKACLGPARDEPEDSAA